ncbi:hypothetical protein ACFY93_28985 [Streptomyces sp. NPDC008313]|uniref:hypothetical protein n=1 Tax=Streptomyces sp. NPDC008313 TaxID=3364826 RepID=UPI0036EB08E2
MMQTLQSMASFEDPRLARPDSDPATTLSALRSDAALNDPSLLGATESLDQYLVHGYFHGTNAIVIGEPAEPPTGTRAPHVAVMPQRDFPDIVTAAAHFWERVQRDELLNGWDATP